MGLPANRTISQTWDYLASNEFYPEFGAYTQKRFNVSTIMRLRLCCVNRVPATFVVLRLRVVHGADDGGREHVAAVRQAGGTNCRAPLAERAGLLGCAGPHPVPAELVPPVPVVRDAQALPRLARCSDGAALFALVRSPVYIVQRVWEFWAWIPASYRDTVLEMLVTRGTICRAAPGSFLTGLLGSGATCWRRATSWR